MTLDAIIVSALSGIAPVWKSIKEAEDPDQPIESTYFTFNYSTHGDVYADDDPTVETHLIQIHLFAPLSVKLTSIRKQTKVAIHNAGLSWPSVTDASDTECRHFVFECEYADAEDL